MHIPAFCILTQLTTPTQQLWNVCYYLFFLLFRCSSSNLGKNNLSLLSSHRSPTSRIKISLINHFSTEKCPKCKTFEIVLSTVLNS